MFTLVLAGAFVGQLALRSGVGNVAATLAVGLTAMAIGRDHNRGGNARGRSTSVTAAGLAALFATMLAVRASTWLVTLNALTSAGLVTISALAADGFPQRVTLGWLGEMTRRTFAVMFGPLVATRSTRAFLGGRAGRLGPVVRGIAFAAGPFAILAALLVSADAAFAEVVSVDIGLGTFVDHGLLTAVVAVALTGLVVVERTAVASGQGEAPTWASADPRPLGGVESVIVVGSIAVLYASFAVVQLMGALGQTAALLAQAGISPAHQARSGYFQLLWAAGLTAGLLAIVMLLAGPTLAKPRRWLAATVAMFTVLLVATAIRRLGLYTEVFGQTTLRWYSAAFAWVLGVGFVMLAVALAAGRFRVMTTGLVALLLGALVVVNVVNPEARIAAENIARARVSHVPLDADYLTGLSADAWPTLLEHHDVVADALGAQGFADGVFYDRCHEADGTASSDGIAPIAGTNLARVRLTCPD